ncbi:aminotransferase class IV [Roseococcus sp.]|uniref:aminotransferase class IV n=1 Tax=Roseococcus sp. TaxID=2109646 RepID=UPI003BAAC099
MTQPQPPSTGIAWSRGAFIPAEQASISPFDFGFTRSDVTYDVVHVWDGSFFRLEQHLDRFLASVAALRMVLPVDRDGLREILTGCVSRSGLRDAYVAMVCTRGRPPAGLRDLRRCENQLLAYAVPFVWVSEPAAQVKGVSAIISSIPRIAPESVDPTVKNYHWLDLERSLFEAYDRGADTAILLGPDGNVTEGPGFNVFAVTNGRVATPDRGVLEGITRQTVIDICAERGLPVEVRAISREEFLEADEIFMSTTAGGVMPITRIEGRILGNGAPGAVTMSLREAYWARHRDPRDGTPVTYEESEMPSNGLARQKELIPAG